MNPAPSESVTQDTGRGVGPSALEVIANIDAMQLAIEQTSATRKIVPEDLLAIHRVLPEQAPNRATAGRFRDRQNWIGGNDYNPCGAEFVPPPPGEVVRWIDDLCKFCNADNLSPLVQAAIAHAQFETIHPFEDGNGRIAEWLGIFVAAAARAATLATRYVELVTRLQAGWREQLEEASSPRADAAAWAIIEVLPAYPMIAVPVAVAATGRGKPWASST